MSYKEEIVNGKIYYYKVPSKKPSSKKKPADSNNQVQSSNSNNQNNEVNSSANPSTNPPADLVAATTTSSDLATPTDFDTPFTATDLFTTTKTTGPQFFPDPTSKVANSKLNKGATGQDTSSYNENSNAKSIEGNRGENPGSVGSVAAVLGVAVVAFGLVGLFIHRKINAGQKSDLEKDDNIMFDSNDTFDNKKFPGSPSMSQQMDSNNDDHLNDANNDIYSDDVNIPSFEPLSPLQFSPMRNSQILNDNPSLPPLVLANNIKTSEQSSSQPPISSKQSVYGESLYATFYTTTPSPPVHDKSQSRTSLVDLSRSTAYPQPISNINNYDNTKETDRYSFIGYAENYIPESELMRPDSSVLTDFINSPEKKSDHQITYTSTYREPTSLDTSTYLPTSNPVVPITLDSKDSGNLNQSNNAYINQNIQLNYVQPTQGTIQIETLDLNITDSTLAPTKVSLEIQQNNSINYVLSDVESDTSSPEKTSVEKQNIQVISTEIVPIQSNMQIENIQDIIQNDSENTNDPTLSDTNSSQQTSETNSKRISPKMMNPATTVFVNPIQSKMKIESVDDELQPTINKAFISTPSANIAARASPFTVQQPVATTISKKSSNNALQNLPPLPSYDLETIKRKAEKPNTTVTEDATIDKDPQKDDSPSIQIDDNKVDYKSNELKPNRDSDQEPIPRKSILKNKVTKSQKTPQDIKIVNDNFNDLVATHDPVEKTEALYRSPTFSVYKMYDLDLPGGRNSTVQPEVPKIPSNQSDNNN